MSHSYRCKRDFNHFSITVGGFNHGIHQDKKDNNRKLRRKAKFILHNCQDYDNLILPEKLEEVMERWMYLDDGRGSYWWDEILEFSESWWHYKFK